MSQTPDDSRPLDELIERLVWAEAEGPAECDSTLAIIKAELDTLASQIRGELPELPYADESGLARGLAEISEIFVDAGREQNTAPGSPAPATIREYRLLEKLGAGGMGAVYRAVHTKLDRVVAIKLLAAEKTRDPAAIDRFEREMRAIGKLDDPHIVRAMDAGEEAGIHFLVMELLDGLDLSSIARRMGSAGFPDADTSSMTVADACEMIRQAACGLQAAHQNGMVHRDIKPSNLVLVEGHPPMLKVLDLGLALLDDLGAAGDRELTATGQVMGTIDYMAPEQAMNSHIVDIRADIYSLGATLYRLLTGTVPFSRNEYNTPAKRMMALVTATAPSLAAHRADLPEALVAVVDRMLAKDPEGRYATPQEVLNVLTPFAIGADLAALLQNARRATERPHETTGIDDQGSAARETSRAAHSLDPTFEAAGHILGQPLVGKQIHRRRYGVLAAALGVIGLIILATVLLRVPVPDGTLIVKLDGGKVVSTVLVDGQQVIDFKSSADGKRLQLTLEPGTHSLTLRTADGTELKTDVGASPVVIVAGRQTEIRAWFEAALPEIGEADAPISSQIARAQPDYSVDRSIAEWVLTLNLEGKSSVDITRPGQDVRNISSLDQLPTEGYRIHILRLRERVPDEDLNRLARLRWLRGVYITRYDWSSEALAALTRLPHLKELWLDGTGIHAAGLEQLAKLQELESLGVRDSSLTADDLGWIQQLPALEQLNLRLSPLSADAVVHLRQLQKLKRLDVRDTGISDAAIDELASALPNCRIIHETHPVPRDAVDRKVVELVMSRPKARQVFVGVAPAESDWLIVRPEDSLPETSDLAVTIVNLGGDPQGLIQAAPFLGQLSQLDALQVHYTPLDQRQLSAIYEARGLQKLLIQGTGISDEDLAQITALTKLRFLNAGDNARLTDQGIASLATLPRLAILDISNTSLTDTGLQAFSASQQLAFLNVSGTQVSAAGTAKLQRALPDCEITSDWTAEQLRAAHVTVEKSTVAPDPVMQSASDAVISGQTGRVLPDYSVDRSFAEWLLTLKPGGESRVAAIAPDIFGGSISNLAQLPSDGKFRVVGIQLLDEVPDASLKRLAQLRWLNRTWIKRETWSDEDIESLIQLRQLRILKLTGTNLHGKGLERLAELRQLEELVVSDPSVTPDDLAWVGQLPKLTRLSITTRTLLDTENGSEFVEQLPSLLCLELTGPRIAETRTQKLAATLPNCRILHGAQSVARDAVDRQVAQFVVGRTKYPVVHVGVTADAKYSIVRPGGKLPRADVLWLDMVFLSTDFEGVEFVAPMFGELPMLATVYMDRIALTPAHWTAIGQLQSVQSLSIAVTGASDNELFSVSSLSTLERLNVGGNPRITDAGISHLTTLARLAILDIRNTGLTDFGLEALAAAKQLAFLNITNTNVTAAGVAKLQRALPDCDVTSNFTKDEIAAAMRLILSP